MGIARSVVKWWKYTEDDNLILTNFETKDMHVSRCLTRRGFELPLAIRLAHLSFLAYNDEVKLRQYMCKYPSNTNHYAIVSMIRHPDTDLNGFVAIDQRDKALYIVFRGTSSERDVVTDLRFLPTEYEKMAGVNVHSGMYSSLLSAKDEILQHIRNWQKECNISRISASTPKLYISGHSLGGCLATLLAPIVYKECGIYPVVYSMGACPTGNDAFMKLLRDCTKEQWNIVNHLDVVPVLTKPLQLGYTQFPHIAYYDGRGDLVYLSGNKFNDQLLHRIMERMVGWKRSNQILNHLMYLGITSRTACETPLDHYVYSVDRDQRTWLDDDSDNDSITSSCSDDLCDDRSCPIPNSGQLKRKKKRASFVHRDGGDDDDSSSSDNGGGGSTDDSSHSSEESEN